MLLLLSVNRPNRAMRVGQAAPPASPIVYPIVTNQKSRLGSANGKSSGTGWATTVDMGLPNPTQDPKYPVIDRYGFGIVNPNRFTIPVVSRYQQQYIPPNAVSVSTGKPKSGTTLDGGLFGGQIAPTLSYRSNGLLLGMPLGLVTKLVTKPNIGNGTPPINVLNNVEIRAIVFTVNAGLFIETNGKALTIYNRIFVTNTGLFTLTGENDNELISRILNSSQGSFTLTGESVVIDNAIQVNQGSINLNGEPVQFLHGYSLSCGQGSFTLTGENTSLVRSLKLASGQGSFVLNGKTVVFAIVENVGQGSFILNGEDATLYVTAIQKILAAAEGSFTFTGKSITFSHGYNLKTSYGLFTLTGESVSYRWIHVLNSNQGLFTLIGESTQLNKFIQTPICALQEIQLNPECLLSVENLYECALTQQEYMCLLEVEL